MPFGFVHNLPLKSLQSRVRSPPIRSYLVCMRDGANGGDGHLRNTERLSG